MKNACGTRVARHHASAMLFAPREFQADQTQMMRWRQLLLQCPHTRQARKAFAFNRLNKVQHIRARRVGCAHRSV